MSEKRRQRIIWHRFLPFLAIVFLLIFSLIYFGVKLLRPSRDLMLQQLYPREYQDLIEKYSEEFDMDANLIYAVCKIESNFDPLAHSKADARGLMQLTKPAFEWVQYRMKDESDVTYADIFEPEVAIKYGTYMLSLLKNDMGEDERIILSSYHAGMNAVKSWLENPEYSSDGESLDVIPYSDTNWYVEKVLETKEFYQNLYKS